jgi:hypothetical protein
LEAVHSASLHLEKTGVGRKRATQREAFLITVLAPDTLKQFEKTAFFSTGRRYGRVAGYVNNDSRFTV